jgi:two-component system chemotaxis response regulator CheB
MPGRRRVLVIDDSPLVRRILSDAIAAAPDLEVAGAAPNAAVAEQMIRELRPDVLTLDLQMPGMDGITFLRRMMASDRPVPTVVVSSLAQAGCRIALEALEAGATDVVAKPGKLLSPADLRMTLIARVRAAALAKLARPKPASARSPAVKAQLPVSRAGFPPVVIGIGASTGGTEAVRHVLQDVPANSPPIVIVQHIPPVFSKAFAQRLDQVCAIHVREAQDGDPVTEGCALVAPGDSHLTIVESSRGLVARLTQGERVCYQRPSVDVLFSSMAKLRRSRCVGVVLTGMGSDGAEGLLAMRRAGARTVAQDEATSVVYGMPRQAVLVGAAEQSAPLHNIGRIMCSMAANAGSRVSGLPSERP